MQEIKTDNRHLVLFDFDGTITHTDTFTPFIRHACSRWRFIIISPLLILALFLHKTKLINTSCLRKTAVFLMFKHSAKSHLDNLGEHYAKTYLPNQVREVASQKIKEHKYKGHRVVIVSASLAHYLKPWAKQWGVELVCSELESIEDRLTGKYLCGDCTGANKVTLLAKYLDLSSYDHITAYGDTSEDIPMLAIADSPTYKWKPFKKQKCNSN